MEEKINIAKILKDKPQGTKLYSILSDGECFLNEASEDSIYIDIDNRERFWCFSVYGSTHSFPNGCMLLFPSKEMRDWRKFSWKKGDVLVSNDSDTHIIFKGFSKSDYTTFEGKHWISVSKKRHVSCLKMQNVQDYHIEDNKESAQTYINTIEERLGGKLNRETFEIEKVQPEFKDGDVVALDTRYIDSDDVIVESFIVRGDYKYGDDLKFYAACSNNKETDVVYNSSIMVNKTSVRKESLHLSTEEEKQQLFSALAKEGKAWDAEKKQVVDLKPNVDELKPFDKVLVRDSKSDYWRANLFSHKNINEPYYCVCASWNYCIPYEGNEHLLGTTKDVKK